MLPSEILQRLIITAEVCGSPLSEAAAEVMARGLAGYDSASILEALRRCTREISGRVTLAAIIERIPTGHPGADEAWAMCPMSEADTVVWTDEIAAAYAIAGPLREHDEVGARMAFRDAYRSEVASARDDGRKPRWWPSLGHDVSGRISAIRDAVARGRIADEYARRILPADAMESPKLPSQTRDVSAIGDVIGRLGVGS